MDEGAILILGGYGEAGRRLAWRLAARSTSPLILAGRDRAKAEALAAEVEAGSEGACVSGLELDVSDGPGLRKALEGVALLINATSAGPLGRGIAEGALDAGVDWLDLQFAPSHVAALDALAPRVEDAGLCFVTQAGFHPGVPAVLVRWAAAQVDDLRTARVAGLLRPEGGMPYTTAVDDLVESFRHYRAHVYRDGVWRRVRFMSLRDLPVVEFAFGFGPQRTYPWDLDEMRLLPELVPGLRETGFSVAGFDPVTDSVVSSVVMLALPLFGRRAVAPMGRLLCWSTRIFGRAPHGIVVQLNGEGLAGGERVRIRLGLFHEDGYEMTAIPVVSMAEQILDGSARRQGMHRMGLLAEPGRLLRDVGSMGVGVSARVARRSQPSASAAA